MSVCLSYGKNIWPALDSGAVMLVVGSKEVWESVSGRLSGSVC